MPSRRPVVAIAAAFVCSAFTQCSSFTEETPSTTGDAGVTADGAGADASGTADGGGGGDAGAEAAAPVKGCEAFNTGWEAAWTEKPAGAIVTTGDDSVSPPSSGQLNLAANATRLVERDLDFRQIVTLTGQMRVTKKGAGEVDFFGISTPGAEGAWIVHANGSSSFVVEAYGASSMVFEPLAATFAAWTAVKLEIHRDVPMLYWSVGGQSGSIPLAAAFKTAPFSVVVGARFADLVVQPWTVRFDDVCVELKD